jgi:ribosome-associated heat shock protein Hsp15
MARIDKWLWAVRLFKTRTEAADACKGGKVKVNNDSVKPSRELKVDEIVTVQQGVMKRTVRVKALLEKRVGAKLVNEYMDDLTPGEEYEKLRVQKEMNAFKGYEGKGRPTKKERRNIDRLFN